MTVLFERIVPDWSICMDGLADPIKSRVRVLALTKLLHTYGGMLLPNSTVVLKDMKPLYDEKVSGNRMFTGEMRNKSDSNVLSRFGPNHKLLGCVKGL